MNHVRANSVLVLVTLVLCCVAYPAALLAVAKLAFADTAEGSVLEKDGKAIGSRLISQNFTADRYFWPRPSAAGYNAAASGASNLAANNPRLRFRVARQLGLIAQYVDGRPVGPDVEKWFAEKDRLATWAVENPTLAAEWVKTDDSTKKTVIDYVKAHTDVLDRWRKDNPNDEMLNIDDSPDAVAVQYFASYAAGNPRRFPGKDVAGVFFDAWLQEHPEAQLLPIPADLVTASGSGLDPHVTLAAARSQVDRVTAARAATDGDRSRVRKLIETILHEAATAPLGGIAGDLSLVNVLEVNLQLDRELPLPTAR
jgi:K+-transporting ATPase ATPase C chain